MSKDRASNELISQLEELKESIGSTRPEEIERQLASIVIPLFQQEGYETNFTGGPRDMGIDLLASRQASSGFSPLRIGIQFKIRRSVVSTDTVLSAIGATVVNQIDRLVIVASSGFTALAHSTVGRNLPTEVELVDFGRLREWLASIGERRTQSKSASAVVTLLTEMSKRFARIVARDPAELDHLEWRSLERMIAEIFDELGFDVTLTPESKDGGKDVIVEYAENGLRKSYLIEVKHWRSGKHVGQNEVRDFVKVIAREHRDGGLYLATHGYTDTAFESLTEIEKRSLNFGKEAKVVALCRTFLKSEAGIWSPPSALSDVIYA